MATRSSSHQRLLTLSLAAVLVLGLLVGTASANTAVAGHEIEADLETNTITNGDTDWAPNNGTAPGGTTGNGSETALFTSVTACPATNTGRPSAQTNDAKGATLICDSVSFPGQKDANIFSGGAKEDDPNSQTTTSSSVTPKTDLTNAYARGVINGNDDAWVIAAYEVIPKQGSYHTNVEFNQKVRCVTQNIIVDQASDCNANEQVVPFRSPGDALLAVDIGGSNDPNKKIQLAVFIATDHDGNPATNAVYDFPKGNETNEQKADYSASGASAIDTAVAKVFLNGNTIDCGPWGCYNENYQFVQQLPAEAFVETAFNISAFSENVCLNNVAFKSRASGQSITSQLKDTTDEQPFPFCGGLSVRKYIDPAENKGEGSGSDDLTTAAAITTALTGVTNPFGNANDLGGWSINVYDDSGTTAGAWDVGDALVCTGTTLTTGIVSCTQGDNALSQLSPGKYHVREVSLKSGWQNTDPGGSSAPFTKTVDVGLGGNTTAWIGNTCLMTAAFTINGVPAGTSSSLVAWYDTGADADVAGKSANATDVSLTGTTTRTGTSARVFKIGDKIEVGYSIGSDVKVVTTHTFAVADAYPKCRRDVPLSFDAATIVMEKYKDLTNNGKSGDDTLLGGWQFNLYQDNGDGSFDAATDTLVSGSPFTGATSGADLGKATKTGLAPGVYHVTEVEQTNWLRTTPSTSNLVTLTVGIGGTQTAMFANTPLSRVKVEFEDLTGYTDATITCPTALGSADSTGETDETESVESSTLPVGTYQCTVVIEDP